VASIRKVIHRTGRMSWQARWRDPTGAQHSKNFRRRIDAERFQPQKRIIRIEWSLAEVRGHLRFGQPKTAAARQAVTFPPGSPHHRPAPHRPPTRTRQAALHRPRRRTNSTQRLPCPCPAPPTSRSSNIVRSAQHTIASERHGRKVNARSWIAFRSPCFRRSPSTGSSRLATRECQPSQALSATPQGGPCPRDRHESAGLTSIVRAGTPQRCVSLGELVKELRHLRFPIADIFCLDSLSK